MVPPGHDSYRENQGHTMQETFEVAFQSFPGILSGFDKRFCFSFFLSVFQSSKPVFWIYIRLTKIISSRKSFLRKLIYKNQSCAEEFFVSRYRFPQRKTDQPIQNRVYKRNES